MPFIIPTNNVVLYSDVNITDNEQIAFSTSNSQIQYFARHKVTEFLDCTYIRKSGYVRLEVPTRTVCNCNYMSFTNNGFENKTFYARIVDWRYVNNVTTDILFDVDWFQTNMFEFNFEPSYIEREHLSEDEWSIVQGDVYTEDVPSLMTLESLDMGTSLEKRYDTNSMVIRHGFGNPSGEAETSIMLYLAGFKYNEEDDQEFIDCFDLIIGVDGKKKYARSFPDGVTNPYADFDSVDIKIPNAYDICILQCMYHGGDLDWDKRLTSALNYLAKKDGTHNIIGIYYVPTGGMNHWLNGNGYSSDFAVTISPTTSNIVNKKLLRSPFQYVRVYNGKGDIKEYFFEKFIPETGGARFTIAMTADPLPMISLFPVRYTILKTGDSKVECNVDERIDYGYLPQVGYCTDAYLTFLSNQYMQECATRTSYDDTSWLVNQVINAVGTGLGVGATIAGASAGSGSMAMAGAQTGLSSLTSAINEQMDKETREALESFRNGNQQDADAVFGRAKKSFVSNEYHAGVTTNLLERYFGPTSDKSIGTFTIVRVQPTDKIMKLYDEYFSTYGYATNQVKIPNVVNFIRNISGDRVHFDEAIDGYTTGRTFCKTRNAHVISNGGAVVSAYIENLFNNGCFFLNGDRLQ